MLAMAALAGETASAAVEAAVPSRLRDSNGHNGMHPTNTVTHAPVVLMWHEVSLTMLGLLTWQSWYCCCHL